jgi:hypothetical protein
MSTRLYRPKSTLIADPMASLDVDSSTMGEIYLWQSSPAWFTQLNVPYHIESYVNAHSSRLTFLDHFKSRNNLISLILHSTFFCYVPTA